MFRDGDFDSAMTRMRRIRAAVSINDSAARYRDMGVDVFFGDGRFVTGDQIKVEGATLTFRRRCSVSAGIRWRSTAVRLKGRTCVHGGRGSQP